MSLPARSGVPWLFSLVLLSSAGAVDCAAAEPEFRGNLGVGYDLTNQIYFEQTFDSTAFSGRHTVSDPEGRLQALADAFLRLGYGGESRLRLENRLSAGEKLIRNLFFLDWKHEMGGRWRWLVRNELAYRRDSSFGPLQQDVREVALVGLEKRSADLSTSWRLDYRFDLAETRNDRGISFYPNYRYHRFSVGFDRFNWMGPEWGLRYTLGVRAFPDTSVRNYIDHAIESRFRLRSAGGIGFEWRGFVDRRSAREAIALGDRYLYGEAEARLRLPLVPNRWIVEVMGGFRGTSYDIPNAAYFHNTIPRAEVSLRFEQFPHWTATTRLMTEILRVPGGGGLGDPEVDADAANAAREEYGQLAVRVDLERLGERAWFFISPSAGRRDFRRGATAETNLLARSSYWFAQVNTFAETRLGPVVLFRISLDLLHERHDIVSDDLTSLYLASELRYVLAR
jgi:hypothetical protein